MKHILLVSALSALLAISAQGQGTIKFGNDSTTKISTNAVVGGAATGFTSSLGLNPQYRFALFRSTNATTVNGQAAAIAGGTNVNYAFSDANWTLVSYGSNTASGQFVSAGADIFGRTAVPGVAGGSAAQFVVIGWSANDGTTIANLQSWFNGGNPGFSGWIGQSDVSGAITLGTSTAATLFSTSAPGIKGFILGRIDPLASVSPVITVQPVNKSVPVGGTTSFSVSAYGTPAPTYQWYYNTSTLITGATGSTLSLTNVQMSDAGTYSVLISNTAGSTNSFAATLTVTAPSGNGFVVFANTTASATRIYTNSAVGGPATGLTGSTPYYFALYGSTNATSVSGQTAAIVGGASTSYAFNDGSWTLAAYGTNYVMTTTSNYFQGMFKSANANGVGRTPVPGIPPGVPARLVVIGWSGNIGTTVADLQSWFNGGSPASDGWIGQSAVSGSLILGDGASIPTPPSFGAVAPYLQGFTLGLVSPVAHASYQIPYAPPALVQTTQNGTLVRLSWLTASGNFGVQSADSLAGPWSDTGYGVTNDGTTSSASVPPTDAHKYFRLVAQ